MSIDINKVINVLQQSSNILQSKSLLLQRLPFHFQKTKPQENSSGWKENKFNIITQPISEIVVLGVKIWGDKVSQLSHFYPVYKKHSKILKQKAKQIKNNTSLLTKQQQLISEIQEIINKYENNNNPLEYFDIKYRENVKQAITNKLKQVEQASLQTQQSLAPLYSHKIEKQLKYLMYESSQEQTNNDHNVMRNSLKLYNQIRQRIGITMKNIQNGNIFDTNGCIEMEMHFFFEENSELIARISERESQSFAVKKIVSHNKGFDSDKYYQKFFISLTAKLQNVSSYWRQFSRKAQQLIGAIDILIEELGKKEVVFQSNQKAIFDKLQNIFNDIGRIFNVEMIYTCIKNFNETYDLVKVLKQLKKKVHQQQHKILNQEAKSKDYLAKVTKEMGLRSKNFKCFLLQDKEFFSQSSKNEKHIVYSLVQSTCEFLQAVHNISKNINKAIDTQKEWIDYEEHMIGKMVNRMIIQDNRSFQDIQTLSHSRKSSSHYSMGGATRKQQKNEKLGKIEKDLDKIFIYEKQEEKVGKQFSAALGPKFLLHGKIKICSSGIYYQSFFNKRNVFFGKTMLFIEKQEILEIDQKNTLHVFPDAIQIKTSKGSLYFHALGSRKQIYQTLIEQYFPENNIDEPEYITEGQFNQFQPKGNIVDNNQNLLEPLDEVMIESTFKGSRINRFFRRYFGNDKFQIRGKTYENFKTYFLEQIEAIQPKGTQLTPEPPYYFFYKNQAIPENYSPFSQRLFTYRKAIPKIPFVSKGGQGLCEERQTYYWFSPSIFVLDSSSVVKGFSLTEGMTVRTRTVVQEEGNNVKLKTSGSIIFSNQSSTNSLLKAPALSNLKSASIKMSEIIQKYEKGKKGVKSDQKGNESGEDNLNEKIQNLIKQNNRLKDQIKMIAVMFGILYLLSMSGVYALRSL